MIHQLMLNELDRVAWKNGAGMTRELLAWPNTRHWHFRVSVADIAEDCTFSPYPGVDRWFAVLEGKGVNLSEGLGERTPLSAPLNFDGAHTPSCRLLGGDTSDLNVMIKREHGTGWLRRLSEYEAVNCEHRVHIQDETVFGIFSTQACDVSFADETHAMNAMSMLWCDCSLSSEKLVQSARVTAHDASRVWCFGFRQALGS